MEDKTFQVEDKVFSVEDKQFTVEDKTFQVEDRTFKVEDRVFNIEDRSFRIEDKVFQVEDRTFKVEDKVFQVEDKVFKVESSGSSGNNVGGEKFDQLSQLISTVKDQLISVKMGLEDKITMLSTNNVTSDIDRQVSSIVDGKILNIQQDINGLRYTIGDLSSNMRQKTIFYESKFNELDYKLSNALNVTGVGRFL